MGDSPAAISATTSPDAVPRDLPTWLWAGLPPVLYIALLIIWPTAPELFNKLLLKEVLAEGKPGGLVEHLTVIVLLPGLAAGFWAALRWGRHLPGGWLTAGWFALWSLACVYFAGEEASWGQHLFGWETPDWLDEFYRSFGMINDQGETNLHNASSWLDQKPRAIVELWIVIAGIIIPMIYLLSPNARHNPRGVIYWLLPTPIGLVAASLMLLVRVLDLLAEPMGGAADASATGLRHFITDLGGSEVREYYIALFLSLYLLSFWQRARQVPQ